ncbi:MAG: c-type cytochrome [Methylovirgula sp.]|nr:c-type cytochrome [Methylovirgula sp.]
MRTLNLPAALHLASLAAALAVLVIALHAGRAAGGPANQEFQAKLNYCETCHGPSAQGFRGYFAMPRLAGQHPQYIENELRAFIERRRKNPVMFSVAHTLKPTLVSALATHFEKLNPPPYGGAPRAGAAFGKEIFEQGLPEDNVPACFACHGLKAEGRGQIPRLAGQLYWYIIKVLTNWSNERGQGAPDISAIMLPTTHNLTRAQVEALAAYLSSLR